MIFESSGHAGDQVNVVVHTAAHTAVHQRANGWLLGTRIKEILCFVVAVHRAPGESILKLFQFRGHQSLSLSQRSVAPIYALVNLGHGVRGATAAVCAAAEHATLHFTDVVPLQALDHFFHHVLHARLMCLCHFFPTLFYRQNRQKG